MIPIEPQRIQRLTIKRNRDCFLLGASWSHHHSFSCRRTHFYLGFWVLTIRTAGNRT